MCSGLTSKMIYQKARLFIPKKYFILLNGFLLLHIDNYNLLQIKCFSDFERWLSASGAIFTLCLLAL